MFQLRREATGPITFMCAPIDSGIRLGSDRDEDGSLNQDDCAPLDKYLQQAPSERVRTLKLVPRSNPGIVWDEITEPGIVNPVYELAGGTLSDLKASGLAAATDCLKGDVRFPRWDDTRPPPPAGDGYFYFVRARNGCGAASFGPGRSAIETLDCTGR